MIKKIKKQMCENYNNNKCFDLKKYLTFQSFFFYFMNGCHHTYICRTKILHYTSIKVNFDSMLYFSLCLYLFFCETCYKFF